MAVGGPCRRQHSQARCVTTSSRPGQVHGKSSVLSPPSRCCDFNSANRILCKIHTRCRLAANSPCQVCLKPGAILGFDPEFLRPCVQPLHEQMPGSFSLQQALPGVSWSRKSGLELGTVGVAHVHMARFIPESRRKSHVSALVGCSSSRSGSSHHEPAC